MRRYWDIAENFFIGAVGVVGLIWNHFTANTTAINEYSQVFINLFSAVAIGCAAVMGLRKLTLRFAKDARALAKLEEEERKEKSGE